MPACLLQQTDQATREVPPAEGALGAGDEVTQYMCPVRDMHTGWGSACPLPEAIIRPHDFPEQHLSPQRTSVGSSLWGAVFWQNRMHCGTKACSIPS